MLLPYAGIYGVFAVTLIRIVHNCLQLLSCPVVLIIAIYFCMVLLTLTSQGFSVYRINWPRLVTKSPPFTRSIPLLRSLHWLPVRFGILLKISLLTYKILREKQPVYLHSILATSIPSHSLRSNYDNSLSVPRVKTNTGARAFHSCARLFGTTSRCLSVQPSQVWLSRHWAWLRQGYWCYRSLIDWLIDNGFISK